MIFIYYITNTFRGIPIALSRSRDLFLYILLPFDAYRKPFSVALSLCVCVSLLGFIFLLHVNKFLLETQTDNFIGAWCMMCSKDMFFFVVSKRRAARYRVSHLI